MGKNFTYTLTFAEAGENHAGMQIIGEKGTRGYDLKFLKKIQTHYSLLGCETELIRLHTLLKEDEITEENEAYVLVIRKAVKAMGLQADELTEEQTALPKDTKFLNKGKVMNKLARH